LKTQARAVIESITALDVSEIVRTITPESAAATEHYDDPRGSEGIRIDSDP
jgi:hypothetical protein